jgi:predicted Zn finger-like uncharacterized protein
MITRCPECGARYKLQEEKLREAGGEVQCPVCNTVFNALGDEAPIDESPTVVMEAPSKAAPPALAKAGGGQKLRADAAAALEDALEVMLAPNESVLQAQGPQSDEPPATVAMDAPAGASDTPADAVAAIEPPKPPPDPAQIEVPDSAVKPRAPRKARGRAKRQAWKLKSAVGLVYDFPDVGSLNSWLANRDSASGIEASRDSGLTWEPLESIAELAGSIPKTGRKLKRLPPVAGGGPAEKAGPGPLRPVTPLSRPPMPKPLEGNRPTGGGAGDAEATPAFRPYYLTRRDTGSATKFGLVATGLVLIVTAIQISGLYDIVGALGLRSEIVQSTAQTATSTGPTPVTTTTTTVAQGERSVADDERAMWGEIGNFALIERRANNPHRGRIDMMTTRARVAASEGRYEEAIGLVNGAVQLDRSDPDLYCLLSDFYREVGSLSQANTLEAQCVTLRTAQTGGP